MNKLNVFLFVALIVAVALPAIADHNRVAVDPDEMIQTLNGLLDELDDVQRWNERNPNRHTRDRIDDSVEEMRSDVRRMKRAINDAPIVRPEPPVPPPPQAMPDQDFNSLLSAIKKASFSKEKLDLVDGACQYHFFSTHQVIRVMEEMSFGKDKVAAAAMMHARLIDPDQFFKVYEHLSFDSDKEKLRRQIGQP